MAKKIYLDGKEVDKVCIKDTDIHHIAIVAEDEKLTMWQWVKRDGICLEFL